MEGVDFGGVVGVGPWVVLQVAAGGVFGDVGELVSEVFGVAGAVLVEAGLPDSADGLDWQSVGEAALDAWGAAFDGLVYGGS